MTDPQKYYRNNVTGMTSLLDAIALAGIDTLVFSSSCATYGEPTVTPIAEDTAQVPINPYGQTKLICEQMIQDYARAHQLQFAMLRYFNAAGADLEGDLVEDHDPETHLIPCVLNAALGVTEEFRIFGDDYPTPDGTCIRDFIHVGDLAEGHTRALDHLLGGGASLTLNLGTGHGSSILDVIAACETAIGRAIPKRVVAGRTGDPARLVANGQRARDLLGFEPSRSDLPTIVSSALRGLRKVHGVTG